MTNNNSVPNVRQSNFELLRIVSMAMIVVWHFVVHVIIRSQHGLLVSDTRGG